MKTTPLTAMNHSPPLNPGLIPSLEKSSIPGFDDVTSRMVPVARLTAMQDKIRRDYLAAKPYPHAIMDGFFDEEILDRISSEFPSRTQREWLHWDNKNENKHTSRGAVGLPAFTQTFLWQMFSTPLLKF